ncbi:AAA family ATPase [Pseudobythopirellula maris]|nr:AAA family ATPase [Pseudobythopirellula maris]
MSNVLRLAIVDPNDATRESLKSTLLGLDTIWLDAECSRYAFFQDVLEQTHPEVGIVALDSDPEQAIALVEEISRNKPEVSLLVTSSSTDGNQILRTMRAGAKEFLTQPVKPEDLATALERVSRSRSGGSSVAKRGCRVIALSGCTGGVGVTSLGVNLGCALAADEKNSVVLLDLDLALGDADVYLDTIPEYTLTDVAQNIARLDFTLLKRSLTKHATGLYLLPRPVQLEDAPLITPDDIQRVVNLLKATFTHVIIDTSKAFSPVDMYSMDIADDVLMVTQLDLPCLRNVVRLLMSFEHRENLKEKVKIVVNRIGQGGSSISIKKAEATLGREVFWQLPNDFRTMIEVRNNGVPLLEQAPKAAITQSIGQLAEALFGDGVATDGEENSTKARSWLGLWPSKVSKKTGEEPAADAEPVS